MSFWLIFTVVPERWDELKAVCDKHGAVIIEDAAESLGATYKGVQTGNFGNYNAILLTATNYHRFVWWNVLIR